MLPEPHHNKTDDTADLRELIEAVRHTSPPEGAYERARSRLNERLNSEPRENWIMTMLKQPKSRAITLGGLALAALLLVIIAVSGGTGGNHAYAAVVQQLREAITVSFNMDWKSTGTGPVTHVRMAFRKPGLQRMEMDYDGAKQVMVIDSESNQMLVLFQDAKAYMLADLENVSNNDQERLELVRMLSEDLRAYSDDEKVLVSDGQLTGRAVKKYRTGSKTFYLDPDSGELLAVDSVVGGNTFHMTDFRIDDPALTAADFSLTPPQAFQSITAGGSPAQFDAKDITEQTLVDYLWFTSRMLQGDRFPVSINPMEITKAWSDGTLRAMPGETGAEIAANSEKFSVTCFKVVNFVNGMKPANDFHYEGEGVVRGDAAVPVAWWKPEGSATYRVIWGDLTITDAMVEGARPVR